MSARFPHFPCHKNTGIQERHAVVLSHSLHPHINDISLESNAIVAEIVGTRKTPINQRTGVDKPAPLAERNNFVHQVWRLLGRHREYLNLKTAEKKAALSVS